jgi:hypothetical protein
MSRLPTPGGDDNTWGDLLNDFLLVEHNADGTLKGGGSLATKANDTATVHRSGAETITGIKTFSISPTVPIPTNGTDAASKSYVDGVAVAGASDATTSTKGIVQLAGDLDGTAAAPTIGTGKVTGSKIASGVISDTHIASGAAIAKSKLAALNIGDSDVSSLSESKITNLTADLSSKVAASTLTTKGDLFVATAASTITRLPAGSNGQYLKADNTQTSGLIWASAANGADIIHVTGLAGDGATDDGPAIQTVLDSISVSGSHSYEVFVEAPPTGVIFINSTVQVVSDHTTLRFGSPVLYGATGRIRIQGELSELPASGKPTLTVDTPSGSTSLTVNNIAPFSVGDYVVIRGARDATGNPAGDQKEYHSIASISSNTITLAETLDSSYVTFNANPLSPAGTTHSTEVTRAVASRITATPNRGDRTVTVADSSIFAAGDIVQILDDAHTTKPDGSIEASNYKHREIAEVKEVVSSTVIRVSHALHHTYDTGENARVAKVIPVRHSTIRDVSATWSAMSTVGNAFEIKYGMQCMLYNCQALGSGDGTKSWKNQAFRQTDSFMSEVSTCYATNPADTNSGRGYGATLYGSTSCAVRNSRFSSLRHSVLFFNGAANNIVSGCVSEDCCISDYDLHGAECVDNLITGCIAVGGDSAADDGSINKTACKAGNTTHREGDNHNVFSNMLVVNYQGAAFEIVPESTDNTFRDSRVNGAWTGIKVVSNSSNTALVATDIFVHNVDFADVTTALTNINGNAATSMVHGLVIENCRFIRATTGLTPQYAQKIRLHRNIFYDPSLSAGVYAITGTSITTFSVKNNDISGCPRGVKLTSCPSARVYGNIMHDLTEATVYEDAGGNTSALFNRNEVYGFTPVTTVSGTGPSTGGLIDIGLPYLSDTPSRHGYIEWNYDPVASGSGAGQATTTGSMYMLKLNVQTGGTVSNVIMTVGTTAPAGALTSGQNLVGIYDSTGVRIATTADQTTAWGTSGLKTMALTAPVTLQGGRDYYIGVLSNSAAGTAAVFVRTNSGTTTTPNANLSNALQRFSVNGTGQTALPASVTLTSNTGTGAQPFWVAMS